MKSLGIVRERKPLEYRVALLPEQVTPLVKDGVSVFVETGAGKGLSLEDSEYRDAGARVLDTPEDLYVESDLILKVKEPIAEEYAYFREGQMLFCFLHLAANPELQRFLNEKKIKVYR